VDNLAPHWRKFVQNLVFYIITVIVLVILVTFLRSFPALLVLWAVALIWGGILAYRFIQNLLGRDEVTIREEQMQAQVDQALDYKAQIDRAVENADGVERAHLEGVQRHIDSWTAAITKLAHQLSALRQDSVLLRDIKQVPKAIEDLKVRIATEEDDEIRDQLQRTLENRQKQLESLEELQSMMRRAEIQIESTLSQIGTIYSQLRTGQSTDHVADYSRISEDVDEEVRQLEDYLDALNEVKLG
jgi:chromosome segregation ATPase